MKTNVKFLSILLAALVGFSFSSKEAKVANEAEENLVVRHVLRQNATNNEGTVVNTTDAPEANGLVSDVLAQVNTPTNGAVSMRFVAGIDSYAYENAQFNITLKDAEGTVVKAERAYTVSSAYLGVEANNEVKYAADLFGEGYNYLIAYTLTDIPEDYWNYQFDVTAETTQRSLNVATKRVSNYYNVKVNTFKVDGTKLETRYEKVALNEVYTVNAPVVEGYVASHDYVKGYLTEGEMATHNIYYSEVDVWDGSSVSESFSGTGTAEDPYLIQSAADFALLKEQAAAGTTYEGSYFKMTKSVDFNGANFIVSTFAGTFDGNHCSVRGLLLDLNDYSGLFSKTTAGEVKNISTYGEVFGWGTVGAIAGEAKGLLTNCTNYATINGQANRGGIAGITHSKVTNCVNYGDSLLRNSAWVVGGLIGTANGEVENCVNFGKVTGTTTDIGGLIANAQNKVINCINFGDVIGATWGAGGIAAGSGANFVGINCVNYGSVSGQGQVAGIVGKSQGEISNCINNGYVSVTVGLAGGIIGSSSGKVTVNNCVNNADLSLKGEKNGGIAGQLVSGSLITNCVNNGKLQNLTNTSGGIVGLAEGNVDSCKNYGSISATSWNIGGIVGRNASTSTISNCENFGSVYSTVGCIGGISGTNQGVVKMCTNNGSVTSPNQSGGIVGVNSLTIIGCTNTGIVTVTSGTEVGEICAKNNGTIE